MTENKRIRDGRSIFHAWRALGAALVYAYIVAPCVVHAQYDDGTELYLDDSSAVTTFDQAVAPAYSAELEFSPDEAYRQLVAGNARYLREDSADARILPRRTGDAAKFPIATVVYSSDMPTRPTTLTQTTTQDLFLTTAEFGAVAAQDLTAIEYGLVNLQTPLLVVMGHYPSRAVSDMIREYDRLRLAAQAESAKLAQAGVSTLPQREATSQMKRYNLIGPAIARAKEAYPDLSGYDLANVVSEALVWQSLETILMKSTVAQDLVRAGRLNVIAAIVDDQTGKIYWLGAHPLQDEFLKPAPDGLEAPQATDSISTESDFPEALDDTTIQSYVTQYESNPYYNEVVYQYYTDPIYYQPSWELFSRRAWRYRPWCGVWVTRFAPWPYWYPWTPPRRAFDGWGVCYWDGALNFYIGYNRYAGAPIYYDPQFRPIDPYWASDYYFLLDRRVHDPVFDLIVAGRRAELPPPPPPVFRHAPGYHPGVVRPGVGISLSLGGIKFGFGASSPRPDDRHGPGGPIGHDSPRPDWQAGRPGSSMRPGEYPRHGDVRTLEPGRSGGARPIDPMRPGGGVRPVDPIRPGGVNPIDPARRGGGVRPPTPNVPGASRPEFTPDGGRTGGGVRPPTPNVPGTGRPNFTPGAGRSGGVRSNPSSQPGGAATGQPGGMPGGMRSGGRPAIGANSFPNPGDMTPDGKVVVETREKNGSGGVVREPIAGGMAGTVKSDKGTQVRAARPDFASVIREGANARHNFQQRVIDAATSQKSPSARITHDLSVQPNLGARAHPGMNDRSNFGARPNADFGNRPNPGTRANSGMNDRPNFGARHNTDFGNRPNPGARIGGDHGVGNRPGERPIGAMRGDGSKGSPMGAHGERPN